jgi:hypothetical protein
MLKTPVEMAWETPTARADMDMLDAEAMGILGLGDEQLFRAMSTKMRDLRSKYLKQSLNKSSNNFESQTVSW